MADDRPTVLLVEDSTTNVAILLGLLQDYKVTVALDGETALEMLAREIPDVILLDIELPGMDGFAVCRHIKNRSDLCGIPVLFITARTDEASIIQAFDVGGSDYVTKPFHSKELLARVRIQVEYRRATAVTDALTGLANRRAFFTDGLRLFTEARAQALPLAAMMLDIDHLKQINDLYGRTRSDEVLKVVATSLRNHTGHRDLCARLGGGEFALLVATSALSQAAAQAEHLRQHLEGLVIKTPYGSPLSVTASIGVATLTPDCASLDALLARADDCLYAAKRKGGNRVCTDTRERRYRSNVN
ncbi:diguanylate cyclase [uncultured Lamprocystis sp.]|jgi:diguanylate cyclase (GGDEF)-like protein|uniref:diguanylate cyclase n=1 Tax=uncultured Lamprocystis sp. TaxID=543132 RepID=UPI0025FFB9C5|nr:diguanylate cyclase [uncultured Lamprocystis sp.]